jgi:hypothetical protein
MSSKEGSLARLNVTRIPYLNTLVIKQVGGRFFISTQDSIVIDVPGLSFLIKFLVMSDLLSYRVLEGILDEYKRSKGQ